MGDSFHEGLWHEWPVHEVCLSAFEMDIHEVSNAQYRPCVRAGACTAPHRADSETRPWYYGNPAYDAYPVVWVDREQAAAYCAWKGGRLPTEAEWEYAARGGLAGSRYPWGDAASGSDANYLDSGDPWDNDTAPRGSYPANGYGLHDMAGNVWEWVSDWYGADYYAHCVENGLVDDPQGPEFGNYRVVRGGAWDCTTEGLRCAYRIYGPPDYSTGGLGFRCVR